MANAEAASAGGRRLDDVDLAMLAALTKDARTSIRGIARQVGKSAGVIGERLDRLESSGVITGYRVVIDPSKLGLTLEVLIGLQLAQNRPLTDTITELLSITEVASVDVVTGRWDLSVHLRLRDQQHLRGVLINRIWEMTDFRHSETMMILQSYRSSDGLGLTAREPT